MGPVPKASAAAPAAAKATAPVVVKTAAPATPKATAPPVAEDKGLEDLSRSIAMLAKDFMKAGGQKGPAVAAPAAASLVPEEKTKFFRWFVFGLMVLCAIGFLLFPG